MNARKANAKAAIAAIERSGMLLVYPLDNHPEPPSLWSSFYPRTPMRWEWDEGGDDRVSNLWHLRAELSASAKVVYTKWFRGRATFFSRKVFTACLAALGGTGIAAGTGGGPKFSLSDDARGILAALDLDSPLSTKQLKMAIDLRGKRFETAYERALKQLWSRLLIVGFGEVDDGAFPSLALGSTRLLFEDLWEEACGLSPSEARERIARGLPEGSLFRRQIEKVIASAMPSRSPR